MKPELKKGHRWLRVGEIVSNGDWVYDEDCAPVRASSWSIGSRLWCGSVGYFSRPIKKRRAKK